MMTEILLDANLRAFVTGPVAINLSSRNRALLPSIARGYGCKVADDGRRITVFVSVPSAAPVLQDLRAGAPVAVVFCRPNSHATLQFKSAGARILPLVAGDRDIMHAYAAAFYAEIVAVGYHDAFTAGLVAPAKDDAVAVEFVPSAVFDQTPGPEAGKPLELMA
jgi:hypothetical protein